MEELDNPARNLLPVLEEIKLLTDELQNYYKSEEILKRWLEKREELHLKFLEIGKKYGKLQKLIRQPLKKSSGTEKKTFRSWKRKISL